MQGQNYTVVPGSGFSVARTAHRNNTSNYYIDQRRSNFGEVTEMLKGKGIDLDNNRFLILQVTSSKPGLPCSLTSTQAQGQPKALTHPGHA